MTTGRLGPEGLFLLDHVEPLTVERFRQLVAADRSFRITVDYRGLPLPVEELDRVHLVPARAADGLTGRVVLAAVDDGFVFTRIGRRPAPFAAMARVTRVERCGRVLDLESRAWRLIGALCVHVPGFGVASTSVRALIGVLARLCHPLPVPVRLPPPDALVDGVVAKYAHPPEVAWQASRAAGGLEPWEAALFAREVPEPGTLLMVGAAAGREAVAFAERGFTVTGVDIVPALIDEARRLAVARGVAATFVCGDVSSLCRPGDGFASIVVSDGVLEHTPTRARRVALLRALRALGAPGGVMIVGTGWHPTRGPRLAMVDGLRRMLRVLAGFRAAAEPGDRLVRHLTLASDRAVPCFYHAFRSAKEIRDELEAAGLRAELTEEGPWVVRFPG